MVQVLLANGADPNHRFRGCSPLFIALRFENRRLVRILKEAGARGDPETLLAATRLNDAARSGLLDPQDHRWEWPGIWFGQDRLVPLEDLLASGLPPDLADEDGRTPLMAAAAAGRTDNVERLLRRGADPHRRDASGNTALTLAGPHPETARALLRVMPHD